MQNPELEQIARDYQAGKFRQIEEDLRGFLKENAERVYAFRAQLCKKYKKEIPLPEAVKLLLLNRKSINHGHEMAMQKEEIEREAWYRQDWDHWKVGIDWGLKYGAEWRDKYVMVMDYLFSTHEQEYLGILERGLPETRKQPEQAPAA